MTNRSDFCALPPASPVARGRRTQCHLNCDFKRRPLSESMWAHRGQKAHCVGSRPVARTRPRNRSLYHYRSVCGLGCARAGCSTHLDRSKLTGGSRVRPRKTSIHREVYPGALRASLHRCLPCSACFYQENISELAGRWMVLSYLRPASMVASPRGFAARAGAGKRQQRCYSVRRRPFFWAVCLMR